MSLILFVAVALAFAVGEWIEGGVIGFIIVINTVVGFVQVGREGGRKEECEGRKGRRIEGRRLKCSISTIQPPFHLPFPNLASLPPSTPSFTFRNTARSRRCKLCDDSALLWPAYCETGGWWR